MQRERKNRIGGGNGKQRVRKGVKERGAEEQWSSGRLKEENTIREGEEGRIEVKEGKQSEKGRIKEETSKTMK